MGGERGNLWLGWAIYGGVPGTLVAFAIGWPLGLLVGAGAVVAFVVGSRIERERDARDRLDRESRG